MLKTGRWQILKKTHASLNLQSIETTFLDFWSIKGFAFFLSMSEVVAGHGKEAHLLLRLAHAALDTHTTEVLSEVTVHKVLSL